MICTPGYPHEGSNTDGRWLDALLYVWCKNEECNVCKRNEQYEYSGWNSKYPGPDIQGKFPVYSIRDRVDLSFYSLHVLCILSTPYRKQPSCWAALLPPIPQKYQLTKYCPIRSIPPFGLFLTVYWPSLLFFCRNRACGEIPGRRPKLLLSGIADRGCALLCGKQLGKMVLWYVCTLTQP